jgi:glycosyltransferase involved in cell wall biosynthesis
MQPGGSAPTRRLRVAIVAPSRLILGGQAVQAERLLEGWRDDPLVEAWLVPIDPQPPRLATRLMHVRYVRAAISESIYLPRLGRELARADVVHVFSRAYAWFLLASLPAVVAARVLQRPVLVHYHHGEAHDHLHRSRVSRATLARVDETVVPSPYLKDVFATFGLAARVIPNTLDATRFMFRARHRLAPRLLSTRNLDELYNVECTLRAFQIVQRQRRDASLTIAGSGRREASLRELTQRLGLSHVEFVGRLPPERMPQLFDRHDVYIQSPDVDNVPNSIVEAFASGLPVVATAVGGVPALTQNGRLAMLAPRDDHAALASHVLRLLEEPASACRLTRDAREAAEEHAWPGVRRQWLTTYTQLHAGRLRTKESRQPLQLSDG